MHRPLDFPQFERGITYKEGDIVKIGTDKYYICDSKGSYSSVRNRWSIYKLTKGGNALVKDTL